MKVKLQLQIDNGDCSTAVMSGMECVDSEVLVIDERTADEEAVSFVGPNGASNVIDELRGSVAARCVIFFPRLLAQL